MKVFYICILIFSLTFLVFIGIANWTFPKGESHFSGEYEDDMSGHAKPIMEQEPSPLSNPLWVRLFQDDFRWFALLGLIGFFGSAYCLANDITIKIKSPMIRLLDKAIGHVEEQKLDLALVDFNKAIKRDSNHAEFYMYRGDLYYQLNRYSEALADYEKFLSLSKYETGIQAHNAFIKYRGDDWRTKTKPQADLLTNITDYFKSARERITERIRELKSKPSGI